MPRINSYRKDPKLLEKFKADRRKFFNTFFKEYDPKHKGKVTADDMTNVLGVGHSHALNILLGHSDCSKKVVEHLRSLATDIPGHEKWNWEILRRDPKGEYEKDFYGSEAGQPKKTTSTKRKVSPPPSEPQLSSEARELSFETKLVQVGNKLQLVMILKENIESVSIHGQPGRIVIEY